MDGNDKDDSTPLPVLSETDEARVIRVQKLIRGRLARKHGEARAGEFYRKCWDAISGFEYYCNLRTGTSMWQKPTLLGSKDADWIDTRTTSENAEQTAAVDLGSEEAIRDSVSVTKDTTASSTFAPEPPQTTNMVQWKKRFDEGVAFQQQCAKDKQELMKRHRKKIARAMQQWDRRVLEDMQRRRMERLDHVKSDNQRLLQDLYDGKLVCVCRYSCYCD